MKEQLIHILDQSVCLSRKQMKEYLGGTMLPEEMHAAEVHLSSCPLCSMAMDGFEEHSEEALQAIASLNSGFLKEHFDNIAPQIHLNSMAPAATLPASRTNTNKNGNARPFWTVSTIAAAMVVAFGIFWYMQRGHEMAHNSNGPIAMSDAPASQLLVKEPIAAANPASTSTAPTTAVAPQSSALSSQAPAELPKPEKKTPERAEAWENANGSAAVNRSVTADQGVAAAAPLTALPPAAKKENESLVVDAAQVSKMSNASSSFTSNARTEEIEDKGGRGASGPELARNRNVMMKPLVVADDKPASERAEEAFNKGNWMGALNQYKQQMSSADGRQRRQATLMAARCYLNLGNKSQAIELLEGLANGSGPEKRTAKRMLKDLKNE